MKLMKNKWGFTLIELLVVITIIGILGTGATATFTSQIQKARDTTRLTDVNALKAAIEQSYQDEQRYPPALTGGTDATDDFEEAIKQYISEIPSDSKTWEPCNNGAANNGWSAVYAAFCDMHILLRLMIMVF